MCVNIGKYERLFRIVIGLILLIVSIAKLVSGAWIWITFLLSVMLLLTGIFGWCGLYSLLRINTCNIENDSNSTHKAMDVVTKNDIENAIKSDSDLKEVLAEEEKASALSASLYEKKDNAVKKQNSKKVVKKTKKKPAVKKVVKSLTTKAKKKVVKKTVKKVSKKK